MGPDSTFRRCTCVVSTTVPEKQGGSWLIYTQGAGLLDLVRLTLGALALRWLPARMLRPLRSWVGTRYAFLRVPEIRALPARV
jgi:hypothetical protein